MNPTLFPDGDPSFDRTDLGTLLARLRVLEQNQRDILFLLRSLRHALRADRIGLSPETRRIHRAVIRMEPYHGRCPGCLETQVVDDNGAVIPPAEFDHFWGPAYSASVHSWLICRRCHRALNNDRHLAWYHQLTTRFRAYQAAVEAYTRAFGHRTPARLYAGKPKP